MNFIHTTGHANPFRADAADRRFVVVDADLTDAEIDSICAGLRQNAAKVRFLTEMGLRVRTKPNGRPLVNRAHYDAVCGTRGVR